MLTFTIPPPLQTLANTDEFDGPPPFLRVHALNFNQRKVLNPRSFIIQNKTPISLPSNSWNPIEFPVIIESSLPARYIALCETRTLYRRGISQRPIISNTNDTYLTLWLHNDTKSLIKLVPYELMIHCYIFLPERPCKE
jgi:hypothetical protein